MNPLRPEVGVDAGKMVDDLEVFYQATEGKVGTDEAAICRLIATRSRDHLLALNEAYKGRSPKHLNAVQVIIKETSGNLGMAVPHRHAHNTSTDDSMQRPRWWPLFRRLPFGMRAASTRHALRLGAGFSARLTNAAGMLWFGHEREDADPQPIPARRARDEADSRHSAARE